MAKYFFQKGQQWLLFKKADTEMLLVEPVTIKPHAPTRIHMYSSNELKVVGNILELPDIVAFRLLHNTTQHQKDDQHYKKHQHSPYS